jgi:cytochrome c5
MRIQFALGQALVLAAVFLAVGASPKPASDKNNASAAAADRSAQDDTLRLQGEKRFRANCGRCHLAPPKFAPRMAATIVRHMRVRATITDEDARLILRYMSQ